MIKGETPIEGKCWVVTVLDCNTNDISKENPDGCCNCGMLDWLCFNTVEEANERWIKQNNGENNVRN